VRIARGLVVEVAAGAALPDFESFSHGRLGSPPSPIESSRSRRGLSGFKLFRRTSRQVELTAQGASLLEADLEICIRHILRTGSLAIAFAGSLPPAGEGRIAIGRSWSAGAARRQRQPAASGMSSSREKAATARSASRSAAWGRGDLFSAIEITGGSLGSRLSL